MQIAVALFPRFTALDAIGPAEILGRLPGAELVYTAQESGVVRTDLGAGYYVDRPIGELPSPDIVLVPGGIGTRAHLDGGPLVEWLKAVHPQTTYTTSVCTGALILAAAGILDGVEATTHWANRDQLAELGAVPVTDRVVERGKIVTAGGVSSGIDMGLTLAARIAGPEFAQALQLGIEYDPAPPFSAGSPESAPAPIVDAVKAVLAEEERQEAELQASAASSSHARE